MPSIVVCPRCKGSETREIRRGYFECVGLDLVGVVPPSQSGQPAHIPDYRVCGHRFQVGTPEAPPCACGRYSVGECAGCSKPLCGRHGSDDDPFLCAECWREAAQERQAAGERRAADEARRLEEVRIALAVATDPKEIADLLASAGSGPEWHAPCRDAWTRLAASGALRPADAEVVRMRFRKPSLREQETTELWRRPAWRCRDDGAWRPSTDSPQSHCWLDDEASAWREERSMYSSGGVVPGVPSAVAETHWSHYPPADTADSKHLEKSFLVTPGQPARMAFETVKHHYGDPPKTKRRRIWMVVGGGVPLFDWSNGKELRENFARVASSGL